jgi:long-subunit fatty acid transport protein
MSRRALVLAALAALALPAAAPADSVFGIRGLGLLGRPLSARASMSGGAFALFDGNSALNPASLSQITVTSGWGTFAATSRKFGDGPIAATLGSTRFPLFGLAMPVGRRAVVGVSVSDFLDRTWADSTSQGIQLRDSAVTVQDVASSTGGVTDIRVAGAYRLNDNVSVGLGVHALAGSTRLSIVRTFPTTSFSTYSEVATTTFSGLGVSAGVQARLGPRLAGAASARINGRLKASVPSGASTTVALPFEASAGVVFVPVNGLGVAVSADYQTWSRAAADLAAAGQPGTHSVWSIAAGAEVTAVHWRGETLPIRAGYRWRQLPFGVGTASATVPLSEHAVSAGIGLLLAGGRATFDIGGETGSRSAGTASERFTTAFVGLTVRP